MSRAIRYDDFFRDTTSEKITMCAVATGFVAVSVSIIVIMGIATWRAAKGEIDLSGRATYMPHLPPRVPVTVRDYLQPGVVLPASLEFPLDQLRRTFSTDLRMAEQGLVQEVLKAQTEFRELTFLHDLAQVRVDLFDRDLAMGWVNDPHAFFSYESLRMWIEEIKVNPADLLHIDVLTWDRYRSSEEWLHTLATQRFAAPGHLEDLKWSAMDRWLRISAPEIVPPRVNAWLAGWDDFQSLYEQITPLPCVLPVAEFVSPYPLAC